MAKDKKSRTVKKPKPTRLPKRIGGVEIPRSLRAEGGALVDLMRHPIVAELAAVGLAALTAAIRDGGKSGGAHSPAGERAGKAAIDFGQGAAILGTMLAARAIQGLQKR